MTPEFVIPEGEGPTGGGHHGTVWLNSQESELAKLCRAGVGLDSMCQALGRGRPGIIARLRSLGLITHESAGSSKFIYTRKGLPMAYDSYTRQVPPTQDAESKSSPEIFKERVSVSIRGKLGQTLSDQDIFAAIAESENELRTLLSIEHKPAKLVAYIDKLREDIARIVFYVDNR